LNCEYDIGVAVDHRPELGDVVVNSFERGVAAFEAEVVAESNDQLDAALTSSFEPGFELREQLLGERLVDPFIEPHIGVAKREAVGSWPAERNRVGEVDGLVEAALRVEKRSVVGGVGHRDGLVGLCVHGTARCNQREDESDCKRNDRAGEVAESSTHIATVGHVRLRQAARGN